MLVDTHAHLNFTHFTGDLEAVLLRTAKEGIAVINVGTNIYSSKQAIEIAESHDNVYVTIGLHALNIGDASKQKGGDPEDVPEAAFDAERYKALAASKKVVAVGEVGLDYYYKPKTNKKFGEMKVLQMAILKQQVGLAQALGLPVIFHVRMAHDDLIAYLEEGRAAGRKTRGVIHCFTGSQEQAEKYLELGLHIGLNGIIFKMDLGKVIAAIPENRILFETDCPYLTPPQVSGRNEPVYMKYVIERVAAIRNTNIEDITRVSTENAARLFNISI